MFEHTTIYLPQQSSLLQPTFTFFLFSISCPVVFHLITWEKSGSKGFFFILFERTQINSREGIWWGIILLYHQFGLSFANTHAILFYIRNTLVTRSSKDE